MTEAAIGQRLTFEEYLNHDDGTDTHYELVAGELIAMPPESRENSLIALFLLAEFLKFLPINCLCHKDTDDAISRIGSSTRRSTGYDYTRDATARSSRRDRVSWQSK